MPNNPKYEKGYSPSRVIERAADDGTTRFRLTERKVDRDGDVVESAGGRLDNFKMNPVVLFAHGWGRQDMIPIGRILPETIKQTKRFIDGNVEFHDSGSDPFSAMISEKVTAGFLNTGSIGFLPITVSQEPVLPKQTGVTFEEWELLEFSIVPIPSLASATARREFEAFAGKCADYGQPLGDGLLKIVNRHMDLHGGILNARGEAGYEQESRPVVAERDVLDVMDKLQADIHLVKSILQQKPTKPDIETQSHLPSPDHIIRNGQQPTYDIEMISLQLALAEQDLVQAHR